MGAFGGFLGGIGQGVQNQQQADGIGAGGQKQQQGSGSGNGLSSMFGGQWGILPIIKNAIGGGGGGGAANKAPAPTPSPSTTIPNPNPGQQQHGFNGLVPMMKGYYAAHQAKVQDATAAPHISSLQDPTITPEQQAYHLSNLQSIYAGRPEMLKQYGISPPGAVPISLGQPQGTPNSYTPTAQPVNLGQDRSRTSMTVTSPGAGIDGVATNQ